VSKPWLIPLLCIACVALAATSLLVGSVAIPPAKLLAALVQPIPIDHDIVFNLRLPRALVALVAGGMLGLAGAILQTVTRNPLAEPGLMGVSAGAVLTIVSTILVSARFSAFEVLRQTGTHLALAGLVGGMAAGSLSYALARGARDEARMLVLFGVLVTGATLAVCSMLLLSVDEDQTRLVLRWMIGSLADDVWAQWQVLWPLALIGGVLGLASASLANVLRMGDTVAAGLGLRPWRARLLLIFIAALLTAGAVSVIGGVGFVGLIGPHLARQLVGADARRLFPTSILVSAALLLSADLAGRLVPMVGIAQHLGLPQTAAAGLPVGAITPVLGVPFFFMVLHWRRRRRLS
jgi:iron complex transport system permease protein